MKKSASFVFWLCASGAIIIVGQHTTRFLANSADGPSASDVVETAMAVSAQPTAANEAAAQFFSGLDATLTTRSGPLSVSRTADRLEAFYTARLESWAHERVESAGLLAGVFGGGDTLSRVFRYDLPGLSIVGVVREPEGFEEPNFDQQKTSRQATDMMSVTLIRERPGGSSLATYRFDGRNLAPAGARARQIEGDQTEADAIEMLFEHDAGKSTL
ncbi:hypothetical protein [Rhizobium sp. L1K21]|uniref:hypothetical protein n=1 Tax=Rhizobium sp. L1K21 TaxID=2954933 RepID=UPI0020929F52|nr:hypothetical protein [Rhizobium sp. L1K21]MCO6188238.1 hypothetical protein [Rhizobium sp. L1K21]